MTRKSHIDLTGAVALTLFSLNLGFNQVVIKVANVGFQPVFMAGLRSLGALVLLALWMWARGISLRLPAEGRVGGIIAGLLFAVEFICLFLALDLTSVARTSILFYSMPVWLALGAHVLLPGERLTGVRMVGLGFAMGGVVLALLDRDAAQGNLLGDLFALGAALCWAGIALCVRVTPLSRIPAEQQLFWQLLISAPVLILLAPYFGPLLRNLEVIHVIGLAYQIVFIASFGFLFWFYLMKIYPASGVASFSFLSPVFAVVLGWVILGEDISATIWLALGLVAVGLVLINRK
ncbi:DMT family transporter [Tateyamaria omphalii]|uniref:EamA family transporter n=1 Tax=Tateyamaria omphalii TaxID=299262 RepID=A0A1P8MTF9_9RHOB|nr:DMT family transporter [Tateyamaria omphalii]APX11324.1 EamA family transporter [Tateyamaria omphalii]